MSMDWSAIASAAIVAGGALGVQEMVKRGQRENRQASEKVDQADVTRNDFNALKQALNERIDDLKSEVKELREDRDAALARCDDLDHKFDVCVDYVRILHNEWGLSDFPPDPPVELIPPLSVRRR